MERDRIDILLKEYEICEQDNTSASSNYWTSSTIFIGINSALLGWVATLNINEISRYNNCLYMHRILPSAIFTTIIGLAAIAILVVLFLWLQRVALLLRVNNFRMKQIETELGMARNRIIFSLDECRRKHFFKWMLPKDYQNMYPQFTGRKIIGSLIWILICAWVFFVVASWSLPYFINVIK